MDYIEHVENGVNNNSIYDEIQNGLTTKEDNKVKKNARKMDKEAE